MSLLEKTKFILKKYGIDANKKLGQNFLINDEIVNKIIEASNVTKEDLVIEIGPGLGTLTNSLLQRAGRVICIELDTRMINVLNDRFAKYDNFELINNDVLKVNLKEIIESKKNRNIINTKIVANLPYYITTPIIMKLLEDNLDINSITIMIQKEVAERLISNPGESNTGAITYAINYYTKPEKVIDAKNICFLPEPKVNSTVIKLTVEEEPRVKVDDSKILFKVIKIAFMQRRKTLLNSLSNGGILPDKKEVEDMLINLKIDTKIRPEKLTLEDFAKISDYISKKKN